MTKGGHRRHFLWPAAEPLTPGDWVLGSPSSGAVEEVLFSLFPETYPVLFSSGRAALTAVLQVLGLGRTSKVWIPGFSSHCVIESLGRFCMPTPEDGSEVSAALIYHQWGWVHKATFAPGTHVIEDAVDTLFEPGSKVLTTTSSYVLWSLPKVIGSVGGGVVFCRRSEQADELRELRRRRACSNVQGWLRAASARSSTAYLYWNGAESLHGELQGAHRSQVLRLLGDYGQLYERCRQLVHEITTEASCPGLPFTDRLPSNLPMIVAADDAHHWRTPGKFFAGLRSFNVNRSWPDAKWVKVAPLPVHKDVSLADIRDVVKRGKLEGVIRE